MKKLLFGIALVVLIALAVFTVLTLKLDPEALGARVIAQINQQSGIRLEAEKFTLHPWRGLEMTDARASGRIESGEVTAELALLRMRHRILPLLRGEVVIDEVFLQAPTIELSSRSAAQARKQQARQTERKARADKREVKRQSKVVEIPPASQEESPERELRLLVESLVMEDGSLSIRSRNQEQASFSVEELNLILEGLAYDSEAPSSTQAVSGAGGFSTGRIVHGDVEADRSSGQIRLAGGVADLAELNLHSDNADLMIHELRVLLDQEPPGYTLDAAGGIDLNGVLGVEDRDGFGPVAIELGAQGEGPEVGELRGTGTVTLNAGSIPGIPSVIEIEELIGQPLLTGRRYERTEIDYAVRENKLVLEPFEIVGEGANIGGSGEIDLAGPLALDVFVRLPRRVLEAGELTAEQLASLADEGDMVTIPFEVGGTVEDPVVKLTWDGVKAVATDTAKSWAEQALDEAKKRATEWLQSQSDDKDDG